MSTHPYIPLYVDDYDAATAHLTAAEDGVYSRLIRLCWRTPGCSLPNDHAWIARKIRLSAADWEAIGKPVLEEFFTLLRGRLIQKRLKAEYDNISRKKSARVAAGKKGGTTKARNAKDKSPINATGLLPHARAFPEPYPEPEPERKEVEAAQVLPLVLADPPVRREASPTRGSRLADDWTPSAENVAYAMRLGFSHGEVDRMAERFRNFWLSKAGKDAAKLDWSRTWQNWASTEADRRPKAANGTTGRVDWV